MNKRLLTDEEFARPTTDEELALYANEGEMLLGRQDAKTLKNAGIGLQKVIRASILTDDGWVYTIPASFVEALKQGRMPE